MDHPMTQADTARFRRRCAQFRWLAVFIVISVGALLSLMFVIAPVIRLARDSDDRGLLTMAFLQGLPAACYLYGVWSIGSAMGQLSRGRLIQPTLASALRRVGI